MSSVGTLHGPRVGRRACQGSLPLDAGRREADPAGRASVRGDGAGDGLTLDDTLVGVWEGLVTDLVAVCPMCQGELRAELGFRGARVGRCTTCGTLIG